MSAQPFTRHPGNSQDRVAIDTTRQPVVSITETGEAMADSRHVAAYFEKNHRDVLRVIRELHCSSGFRERNFAPFKIKDLTGETTSHVLMTKDGFTFLAMGFTGASAAVFKENYIARFNVMEAELRARCSGQVGQRIPQSLPEALRLAADLAEENERQTKALQAAEASIAVLEPRSAALAALADADGTSCITDAAKALQMPPGELFAYLRRAQWIYRRDRDGLDVAYQSKIAAGWLTHKMVPVPVQGGRSWARQQVRVTARGLTVLGERIPLDGAKTLTVSTLTAPAGA